MHPSLLSEKAVLRKRLRARRRRLSVDRAAASEQIAALAPVDLWGRPAVVAAYLPMAAEIDPGPLLRRLAAHGARVALPVVVARDAPLIFREADPSGATVLDAAGLPCPPPSAATLNPDLILTPLLAFDRKGGRLGQGGGYYDRTLRALRARPRPVLAVGLAFAGQEIEHAPAGPLDEPLDAILTEIGYIEV